MRARGTWVLLFFVAAGLALALGLSYALRDIFSWLQVNNFAVLGEGFRLSSLVSVSIAFVLALFFGVFYRPSRQFVEQCVVEFNKVAFPRWQETKMGTFTVVVLSVVASLILGSFDAVFAWWTNNNLFIW